MLEKNGAFFLPDIGVFTLSYRAAEIAFADKSIAPPSCFVDFEPGSGGSGVSSILVLAEHHFPGSSTLVVPFIKKLSEDLRLHRRAIIAGFGRLELNYEGQPFFSSEPTLVSDSNYWGLPFVPAETLASRNRLKMDREVPVIPLHPFDSNREELPPGKNRLWFRPVAVSAVACALIAAVSGVYWLSGFSGDKSSSFQVFRAQEAALVPAVGMGATAPKKNIDAPVSRPISKPAIQSSNTVVKDVSTFMVIAGSFRDPLKAKVRKSELEALGFQVETVPGPDSSWTRVSVGKFSDKNIALAFAEQEQEKHHTDFWVLRGNGN